MDMPSTEVLTLMSLLRNTLAGKLLISLADAKTATGAASDPAPLAESLLPDADSRAADKAADYLNELDLVDGFHSLAGWSMSITDLGLRVARALRDDESHGSGWTDNLCRSILYYVNQRKPQELEEFLRDPEWNCVNNRRVSPEDFEMWVEYLMEHGLLKAHRTWQGPHLFPQLTPEGFQAMRQPHIQANVASERVSYVTNNNVNTNLYDQSSVGNIAAGENLTQSATQTVSTVTTERQRDEAMEIIEQALELIEAEAETEAALFQQVEEIRGQIESAQCPPSTLLEKIKEATVTAAVTAGTNAGLAALPQLLASAGHALGLM